MIQSITERGNIAIVMTPADLKEFALEIINEFKENQVNNSKEDVRLTIQEAADYLGKSTPTLWRWKVEGYLVPDGKIGKNPFYFKSTLDKLGKEEQK